MRTVPLNQSVGLIPDGASLMIGGFMAVGTPERVIDEIETGPGISAAEVAAATEAELLIPDDVPEMSL